MRTRMTNNVRKKALRVLKAQRSKTDGRSANVASSETVRKKSNRSTKRAKKSGKIAKYKEIHSVGRRTSSQFVTYSQDGRLFYDLYARYTPYTSSIKAANTSTSSFIPNMEAPHGSNKPRESSDITASILLANQVPTQTRSASRKQNASTKEENRTSLERTNQRKNAARPRRANLVSQKHSKQNTVTKKAAAKVRLQRKLKRELGLDVIPKMQTVSKRLASINAVAIINAVTRDGSKRLITGVKSTAARRRDSSDTMPCVESKIERVQEDSSVHSDDALTEPMSQSPSAASMNKSVVLTPTSPLSPILCTSSPSNKKTKVTQTSIRMKKSSLPAVPPVTPGCVASSGAKTLVTSTPCRELVAAKPQTSAVESYHTERLIPLGHSGFGFQQITTQVIRYAQPDCSTLVNTNPVLTQVSQATSAANPTTVPVVIRTPGDLVQNMHASDFFNTNRTQTFLSNMALPMLTPMPTLTTWPTVIHPYTHMIQPLHTQLAQPNSAIFIPSLIPVPTQFHYSMMPNMFHHQLNRSPTLLSSTPLSPHAPLPPPPLPSLVPSPMCNLSTVQPTIAPSFGVLRSVPPTLYYSLSSPPFPLRDSAVPLHTSVPAMTACTSSPSLQLPVCNQPIFTPSTPQSVSITLPPLSQDPHFVPTCTFISSPSPLNAFNFSTPTVPSAMTLNPTDGPLSQPDSSITSMGLNTGLGVSVALLHPVIQSTTSTSTPVSHMVNNSLPNGNIASPIITLLSSDKTEQKVTSTQSSVPLTALPNTETASSSDSPTITLEPVVLCAVDGSQNAWQWEGSSYTKAVFCRSDGPPVVRTCYPAIRHRRDGMVIREKDCVLLCSGPDRSNPPHVAKITALFADVTSLETKMMSLLWYYRPEHVGCSPGNLVPNELYASRHCDTNPVECIEDKAYVLTTSAFARYMARLKYRQTSYPRPPLHRVVPPRPPKSSCALATETAEMRTPTEESNEQAVGSEDVPDSANPANVFLCRGVYDYRLKRVCRNVNLHMLPIHSHFLTSRQRVSGRSSPPCLSSTPSEEDADEQKKHDTMTAACSPTPTTPDSPDPPVLLHVDSTPPEPHQVAHASSTEPSPANSPSLCICLPDSPTSNDHPVNVDPLAHSQKRSDQTEANTLVIPCKSTVVTINESTTSHRSVASSDHSAATDRSSTPLKGRESASVSQSPMCPLPKPSQNTNLSYSEKQSTLTNHTSHMDLLGSCTTVTPSMLLQPISCTAPHTNAVWIPPNSMMPLLESSVLETSADLSVNWAEHGEQIALSLDCRNIKPLGMVPVVNHPSNNVSDTFGQIHSQLPSVISAITWPTPLVDRPVVPTDLFGHTQLPILCPAGGATTSPSNVTNPHESETSRLVML